MVCDKLCDKEVRTEVRTEEAERKRGGAGRYRSKNKNPTQRCGEKHAQTPTHEPATNQTGAARRLTPHPFLAHKFQGSSMFPIVPRHNLICGWARAYPHWTAPDLKLVLNLVPNPAAKSAQLSCTLGMSQHR